MESDKNRWFFSFFVTQNSTNQQGLFFSKIDVTQILQTRHVPKTLIV